MLSVEYSYFNRVVDGLLSTVSVQTNGNIELPYKFYHS